MRHAVRDYEKVLPDLPIPKQARVAQRYIEQYDGQDARSFCRHQ
jgi:hypothetical protein